MGEPEAYVRVEGVSKRFGHIQALNDVPFDIFPGEVHAVVGENGAGKSTLVKILAGIYRPDAGSVFVNGSEVTIKGPAYARKLGLSFVHQELAPVPRFTVAEYMNLGLSYPRRLGLLVNWQSLRARARVAATATGIDFPLSARMESLSIVQQRMAEIAQGLMHGSKIVVLDEPTASLSDREVRGLFEVIRELRRAGVGVMYISHRLEEIFEIADRVTVLRDGRRIASHPAQECSPNQLLQEITGSSHFGSNGAQKRQVGKTVLEVRGLTGERFHDISFDAAAGEIVGLAGLVGSGRSEIVRAIFGADPVIAGEVRIDGRPVKIRSPRAALSRGIGLLPEERRTEGLFMKMTIRENVTMSSLARYTVPPKWGIISRGRERAASRKYGSKLQISMPGPEAAVDVLSGGNQQKVMVARLLDQGVRILLLDEATKGIDVGAKEEMFYLIRELAAGGNAIVFISSDLEEVCRICDRVVVLREGRAVGELAGEQLSKAAILELAYGVSRS